MTRKEFENTRIPIIEIFQSISGEGISAGNIVTFIRVAGCNIRCSWCDTKYSFVESGNGVEDLLPSEILDKVRSFGSSKIICTGGEPLVEGRPKRMLPAWLAANNLKIRIETSGASLLYSMDELQLFGITKKEIDYCMDIKCPGSGMANQNILNNITNLTQGDELKFVVKDQNDIHYAFKIIDEYKFHLSSNGIALNFSPVFGEIEATEIVEFLKLKNSYFINHNLWPRLSLQLHKYVWDPHERGV
jgi:7-carboxy-7-deazaguanine synthase